MGRSESLVLASDDVNVSAARRFVRRWLEANDEGVDAAVVDDLVLVASELVTNAVEHGSGDDVRLVVGDDGELLTLAVTSASTPEASSEVGDGEGWHVAEPTSLTGRGLGIVRSLVDEVAVGRTGDRLTITVTRRR